MSTVKPCYNQCITNPFSFMSESWSLRIETFDFITHSYALIIWRLQWYLNDFSYVYQYILRLQFSVVWIDYTIRDRPCALFFPRMIELNDLKRAITIADPEIDANDMERYLAWTFRVTKEGLATTEPQELTALLTRMRNGNITRIGQRMA